jgi:predicted enzyme related to lactoylglutathione lyase
MPNIDHHGPGTFTWIELATTDQTAAKGFYASLFGWSISDTPIGPNDLYTIFKIDGREAAAGYTMRPDEQMLGVPPHWNLYIATDDVDASAKRATDLGGKVVAPPFDVMDAGRMAVIQDPTGAMFCLWKANKSEGIGINGVDGTLCWADLNTPNPDRAKTFYEGLFGWKISLGEKDMSGYLHLQNGEEYIGGIPPAGSLPPGVPPHWMIYFLVSDVDAAAGKAKTLGGAMHMPPMTIAEVGRMAVLADPQGASFAIFTPSRK